MRPLVAVWLRVRYGASVRRSPLIGSRICTSRRRLTARDAERLVDLVRVWWPLL